MLLSVMNVLPRCLIFLVIVPRSEVQVLLDVIFMFLFPIGSLVLLISESVVNGMFVIVNRLSVMLIVESVI